MNVAAVPADRLLAWGRRWGISTASLVAGLATLLVFRRGLPHAHWIVGYLLLIWLLGTVMLRTGDALAASSRRSLRLVAKATEGLALDGFPDTRPLSATLRRDRGASRCR